MVEDSNDACTAERPQSSTTQSSTTLPRVSITSQRSEGGSRSAAIARSRSPRRTRQSSLFAGFHGSDDTKIATLVNALGELWSSPSGLSGHFIDLGCGDGRVVMEVARAFPSRHAIGVELQSALVEKAKATAKKQGIGENCEFFVGDLAAVDLSEMSVVFLYFPPLALPQLLTVLCESNLRNGATIVSADGAWKSRESQNSRSVHRQAAWEHTQAELLELLQPSRICWGAADLYFYTWRGQALNTAEASAVTEAKVMAVEDGVKLAAARVTARLQAQRAEAQARADEAMATLTAARERLRTSTAAAIARQGWGANDLVYHYPQTSPRSQRKKKPAATVRPMQPMQASMGQPSPYSQPLPAPRHWTVSTPFRDGLVYASAYRQSLLRDRDIILRLQSAGSWALERPGASELERFVELGYIR